jgi:hypothetical protein
VKEDNRCCDQHTDALDNITYNVDDGSADVHVIMIVTVVPMTVPMAVTV